MAEVSAEFRAAFEVERRDIENELKLLPTIPKTNVQTKIDGLVQRIGALERSMTEKISVLPAYDARLYVEAIKSMSEIMSQLRGQLVPKQKFSFKARKAASTTSSAPTPAATTVTTASVITKKPTAASIDYSLFMRFENLSHQHLFIGSLMDSTVSITESKDVALTNLTDCTINLVHTIPLGAIHIKNLKRCVLVIPPVSGSILLHDCEDCTLVGACHQSRMHTSTRMKIYLHVTSEPIIEDCTEMSFAPYELQTASLSNITPTVSTVPDLSALFAQAQLDQTRNYYDKVKDFKWLRQQQSPNWRLLSQEEVEPEVAKSVLANDYSF